MYKFVLGMSNLAWVAAGAAVVLLYKVPGRWTQRLDGVLALVMVLAGVAVVIR